MTKHDSTRRDFLLRAAVSAGVVAGSGLVPGAAAQAASQTENQNHNAATMMMPADGGGHGAFFNHTDAATIVALTERIMPGAPGKPGAHDSDVLNYIDLALAGAYADLQDFYRRGLQQLQEYCMKSHNAAFVRLSNTQRDEVLAAMDGGTATGFEWPSAKEFFETLRMHTMEGMFADPVYGGNKDFAGWRLVGFPGAQAIFTPTDLQNHQAFVRSPIIGMQAQAKGPTRPE